MILESVTGVPVGGPALSQVYVRCSDPNVICESRKVSQGEPHDVFMKVRPSELPNICSLNYHTVLNKHTCLINAPPMV